jgi:hypothetical protein
VRRLGEDNAGVTRLVLKVERVPYVQTPDREVRWHGKWPKLSPPDPADGQGTRESENTMLTSCDALVQGLFVC